MTEPTGERSRMMSQLALLRPFGHPMTEPTAEQPPTDERPRTISQSSLLPAAKAPDVVVTTAPDH
jgi:hypothetical protein